MMLQCSMCRGYFAMDFSQALRALWSLRFGGNRPGTPPDAPVSQEPADHDTLAGVPFPAQEPALTKELHLTGQDISGWAMGGSSLSD